MRKLLFALLGIAIAATVGSAAQREAGQPAAAEQFLGTWSGSWDGGGAGGGFELTLEREKDGPVTGKVSITGEPTYKATLKTVAFDGKKMNAKYDFTPDDAAEVILAATFDGNAATGTWSLREKASGNEVASGGWKVTRQVSREADGLPRFDRTLLLEQTSETSANVSIGDLNGDGTPDLVLAKGRHWPLVDRVLLNDGHGRFVAHDLGPVSDRSYSGSLADLDGDGDLDVVIGNDAPDRKLVYLNDGKGNFRIGSAYGRPEWSMRNGAVADLNGDRLPDIVVANRTGDTDGANYICLNRGQGLFDANCLAFSRESATTITAADFTHDGAIDLAVPHRDGGQSHVYVNDGKGGFARRIPFGPADATIRMAAAADLDGDGLTDIVAIDERRGVFIYFNQKNAAFSEGLPIGDARVVPYALALGDLNRDGRIDIVVGHVEAPSTVYFNDGSGRRFSPRQFGDNKGTVYGFAIDDLDKDGRKDIAVARSEAPNVVYFGG